MLQQFSLLRGTEGNQKIDMSIILIMVMISWVYAYLQIHQIVYIKYVQVCISIILNKAVLKKSQLIHPDL